MLVFQENQLKFLCEARGCSSAAKSDSSKLTTAAGAAAAASHCVFSAQWRANFDKNRINFELFQPLVPTM